MASNLPWFPFYVGDFLSSSKVQWMSPAEIGGYVMLLAHAWSAEDCGLPTDDRKLAALSKLGADWSASASTIRECFIEKDGRLFNERLLEVRREQQKIHKSRSIKGKQAAEARWMGHATGIPQALPKHPPSNAQAMLGDAKSESKSESNPKSEEEGEKRGEAAPAGPPDGKPERIIQFQPLTQEELERRHGEIKPPSRMSGDNYTMMAAEWNKGTGWPCGTDKGAKLIECAIGAGADVAKIQAAFWNRDVCKGRKIWQVLDQLTPKKGRDERMREWARARDAEEAVKKGAANGSGS